MIDRDEIISRYLLDEISDVQSRELAAWIKSDPRNADRFATEVFIHSQLRSNLRGRMISRQPATVLAFVAGVDRAEVEFLHHFGDEPRQMMRWQPVLQRRRQ